MNKFILITGATGFLGSHLLKRLLDAGYKKIVITSFPDGTLSRIDSLLSRIHVIDLSDPQWLKHLGDYEIETVVHLATNYGRTNSSEKEIVKANVDFPVSILSCVVKNGARFFVNTDTSLPAKVNFYAKSKKDFLVNLKSHQNSINVVNVILEHFYGPNDGKFVSNMLRKLIKREAQIDLTEGYQRRDFIYYQDVLDAYSFILSSLPHLGSRFSEFHIASGTNYSIRELFEVMIDVTKNRDTLLNWGAVPLRENEIAESSVDISALMQLGWKPCYDLRSGINLMYEEMHNC